MVKNILGSELRSCCEKLNTGFNRDGYCSDHPYDIGKHVVCAIVTDEFLDYTETQGNDLRTPIEIFDFPGLKAGDCWCLCAGRWLEAYKAGVAPPIKAESTHENALEVIPYQILIQCQRH